MPGRIFNEKGRLIAWLTAFLAIGFAATTLSSYFVSKDAMRQEIITTELPLSSDNIYSEIQKDLIKTVFVSSMMAHDTFLRDWLLDGERDPAKAVKYLKEIQKKYGTIISFLVSEKSRVYYHENGILKKVSEKDPLDTWYFRVRKQTAPYELNLDTSEAHDNALTIFVNYRVTDYQGKLIGITGVGLMVDRLRELFDKYKEHYHSNVYLVNTSGTIILHGNTFQPVGDNIHDIPGLKELAGELLKSSEGKYQYRRDQRSFQLSSRFIPELGWHLLVEKAENNAYPALRNTLLLNLAICVAITAIVALLTGMSISRHQTRLRNAVELHTSELNTALAGTRTANQAKSQMLAYIGHDLRALIANIAHYIHLLENSPGSNAGRYRAALQQNIDHQLELIDDLMEYSRGELEQLKLLPAPAYLYDFLRRIGAEGELLAARWNNHFHQSHSPALPPVAVIDAKRLRQVLINLLSNSAKFTSGGDIQLQVSVISGETSRDRRLRFEVADTGIGIPEGDRLRIFLPYERRNSTSPDLGLGLAIASQIVRKMGGELSMESTVGKGSRFWFDIQLEIARESSVLQPMQPFPSPPSFGTGKKVLLVEQDAEMRDYLNELLSLADFDVVVSASTVEALAQFARSRCDAVALTLTAPQEDAWKLLLQLRNTAPGVPMLFYSAIPPQRPTGFPEGLDFHAVLLKPISPEELLETMRDMVA